MTVFQAGFIRAIFSRLSLAGIEPFPEGIQTSGVDDEGPLSGLDRYVGGVYREAPSSPRDSRGEIAVFSDPQRPLEDRLKSIETAGKVLGGLSENSNEFFDGVMALFDVATRPGPDHNSSYQIRTRAANVLMGVLVRMPAGEDRLRVLVHAYLRFVEAARDDIVAEGRGRNALTYNTMHLGSRLDAAKKYCSGVVEAGVNGVGNELTISYHHGPDARFRAPWTPKKAVRNAKIGALAGGACFLSFSIWALAFSLFWPAASVFLLKAGAAVMTMSTAGSFLYKAPQRFGRKLLTWTLRNDRPTAKQLDETRTRLLKP